MLALARSDDSHKFMHPARIDGTRTENLGQALRKRILVQVPSLKKGGEGAVLSLLSTKFYFQKARQGDDAW